ncbi:hypothetical protein HY480_05130 [Candidatus Uhrbacteria bacterium]|nr:hypothetical protein [Candidatus Uhrbacteria bacterium]
MRMNETEPVEVGWAVVAHVGDIEQPIAQSSVAWVPCDRMRLAEGVVAHVPTERSRAWELLIVAKDDSATDHLRIHGLPILAERIRAGKTYCMKRWSSTPVEPYFVFRP